MAIAVAANTEGKREIVGLHIGPSEAETFWATFLKSTLRRGLRGVKLVISDAHERLKAAIRRVVGAPWQRCRVRALDAQRVVLRAQGAAEHGVGRLAPGDRPGAPARRRSRRLCRPGGRGRQPLGHAIQSRDPLDHPERRVEGRHERQQQPLASPKQSSRGRRKASTRPVSRWSAARSAWPS